MAYYGVIFPEFWTGRTGRDLVAQGGPAAQVLALYLATNRHTNMLGLYRLLPDDVLHETKLSRKALEKAWQAVVTTQFASKDDASAYVWVHQMARFRLGLKVGATLESGDNRVLAVNRIYHALEVNPFLGPFFDANHKLLRLKKRREAVLAGSVADVPQQHTSLVVPAVEDYHPSGLEGAYQGACKPGTEIRNRVQTEQQIKATRLTPREADANVGVVRAMVTALLREPVAGGMTYADLKDLAKARCAGLRIAYDAEVVGSAIEQALARASRAS